MLSSTVQRFIVFMLGFAVSFNPLFNFYREKQQKYYIKIETKNKYGERKHIYIIKYSGLSAQSELFDFLFTSWTSVTIFV